MRKFRYVAEYDLISLIRILTDNGKRLEIHATDELEETYDVFIIGEEEE